MFQPHSAGHGGVLLPSSSDRLAQASPMSTFGSSRSWVSRKWARDWGWGCYYWLRCRVDQLICTRMHPYLSLWPNCLSFSQPWFHCLSQGLLFLLMECFQNEPRPMLSEKFFPEIICQLFGHQRLLSSYLLAMSFVWKHKNTLKIFVPLKELMLWNLYHIEMLKTIIFFTKEQTM